MHEAIPNSAVPGLSLDDVVERARVAADWAGEPFLHDDEEPAQALAEGSARRRALDEATVEIEAGKRVPSATWKINYALMLGLERVLSDATPRLASGTELRRHQIDALAGMLTELISRNEAHLGAVDGNGQALEAETVIEEDDEDSEPLDDAEEDDEDVDEPV